MSEKDYTGWDLISQQVHEQQEGILKKQQSSALFGLIDENKRKALKNGLVPEVKK